MTKPVTYKLFSVSGVEARCYREGDAVFETLAEASRSVTRLIQEGPWDEYWTERGGFIRFVIQDSQQKFYYGEAVRRKQSVNNSKRTG